MARKSALEAIERMTKGGDADGDPGIIGPSPYGQSEGGLKSASVDVYPTPEGDEAVLRRSSADKQALEPMPSPAEWDEIGKLAAGAPREIEGQLKEALMHINALLGLTVGFNANHEPIEGWCSKCDGNYLHTAEACACVCHPAREFVKRMREGSL